jgi:hypothetical protein
MNSQATSVTGWRGHRSAASPPVVVRLIFPQQIDGPIVNKNSFARRFFPSPSGPPHAVRGVLELPGYPVYNRKNRRKTRSYCGPCGPLALLIYQTQKQSWIVKTGFQATFCAAGLPQPNPRRYEPEESSSGGKGFRKNFECQFHVRFPQRARPRA